MVWSLRRSVPAFVPVIAFALFVAAAAPRAAAQDSVTLKDGTQKRGAIASQNKTEVVLSSGLGSIKKEEKIPAADIERIRFGAEPAGLNLARGSESGGSLDKALADYQKALGEVAADQDLIRSSVEFLIARVLAKQAQADPAKVDEAIQKLEAFRTANPDHYRTYPALSWLGEAYMAKGDFAKAQGVFQELAQSPSPDFQMASKIAQGRLLLRQNQLPQAAAQFQAVADAPANTPAEKARRYEALLGLASAMQRQNQAEQAAALLDQVIKEAPAQDARTMAQAYIRKGDALMAAGKPKEALMAYLHVDVLFPSEPSLHAEALYHLSSLWNEVGNPERAAEARAQLRDVYGNSEWAKKSSGG
jgi:tetratricopeptide (TPR) repeat protein